MLRLLTLCAAFAALLVPAAQSAPPPPQFLCTPFPDALLGSYHRHDDRAWELMFKADCTHSTTYNGIVEGGGDYTISGDETSGTLTFSNDLGCRGAGFQDLPTPYSYTVEQGVITFEPVSGDLCANERGLGRATDLGGHDGWVKAVAGKIRLSFKGLKRGSFSESGSIADHGSFKRLKSKVVRGVRFSSLRFTGALGTFVVKEHVKKSRVRWELVGKGAASYWLLSGEGTGAAHGSRQSLHGNVSN
jgi:hypothetical protein